jgi:glycosyltransferase involved in cell wall biosynthesis
MRQATPGVSVVITCFNYARYVGECIRSVLAQTRAPLEIIVVDDGSTDGSARVIAGFGARVALIEQENRGQQAAVQRGFAQCRGELVMFLDADDRLHPEALEEVRRAWTPACAKVQFELELIDGAGRPLRRRFCNYVLPYGWPQVRAEFAAFGTYVWPVSSGNAYARWLVERLFPWEESLCIDGALNTLAPLYGEVAVIARTLGCYRLHESNLSYHGMGGASIGRRFARQVQIRRKELRLLAQHAAACGRSLPPGNILDRELAFVNYRLMLQRLGEGYDGAAGDTPARLWRAGMRVLIARPLPLALKLAHAAWLTVLLCSPAAISRRLIRLRFNRAALLRPVRRKLALPA